MTENNVFYWDVFKNQKIKPEDFILFKYIRPEPEYIIIGVNDFESIDKNCLDTLQSYFPDIKIDIIDLFKAATTFNSCIEDNIKAVAIICFN